MSLPETLPELKRLNVELMAKLTSGTHTPDDKKLLVQVMDRIEQVRASSTPSPPPASSVASTTVAGEDADEDGEYIMDTECRENTRRNKQVDTPPEAPKKLSLIHISEPTRPY